LLFTGIKILYTPGVVAEGRDDDGDDADEREPVVPITSPCDRISGPEG
jgi:hypothetical protein